MRYTALASLALLVGCLKPAEQGPPPAAPGSAASIGNTNAAPAPAVAATPAAEAAKPAGQQSQPPSPLPAWKHGENPFVGMKYWTDPYAPAFLKSKLWRESAPANAALMKKIADNGGADWIGDWTPHVGNWVSKRVTIIQKTGALPLFIAYNLPKRDCGNYSAGGVQKGDAYKAWITEFAKGIGDRRAAVIVEPDALGLLKKCLSDADQKERIELLKFAVHAFASLPQTAVYLDAGHSAWMPAADMAARLKEAGVAEADGFSLNVSNYKATDTEIKYGKEISKLIGGKHFVIDTSRNGMGPPVAECKVQDSDACWCNPPGRGLGSPPTAETADPLADAYLWLKKPGESDGECNGGPKAGAFWEAKALELARNAKY
jgi:endoglucanase